MRLVHDDPVRPARPRPELLEPRQEALEERRPVLERDAQQVHDDVLRGRPEQVEHLVDRRRPVRVAQHDGPFERLRSRPPGR